MTKTVGALCGHWLEVGEDEKPWNIIRQHFKANRDCDRKGRIEFYRVMKRLGGKSVGCEICKTWKAKHPKR